MNANANANTNTQICVFKCIQMRIPNTCIRMHSNANTEYEYPMPGQKTIENFQDFSSNHPKINAGLQVQFK